MQILEHNRLRLNTRMQAHTHMHTHTKRDLNHVEFCMNDFSLSSYLASYYKWHLQIPYSGKVW